MLSDQFTHHSLYIAPLTIIDVSVVFFYILAYILGSDTVSYSIQLLLFNLTLVMKRHIYFVLVSCVYLDFYAFSEYIDIHLCFNYPLK
jgi:hypothetical protein